VSLQPSAAVQRLGSRARRPEKLAETVARRIVHDISELGLEAGAVLPSEKQMAAQYGVARGTLREALRILELHGLIQMKLGPGGGPVVNDASSEELGRMLTLFLHGAGATMADLMDARIVIEPMAARAAALGASREEVERLQDAVTTAQPAIKDGEGWLPVSTEFHDMVATLSGNPVLDLLARSLKDVYYARLPAVRADSPKSWRQRIQREHVAIAQAISDGDADAAEQLMRDHIVAFKRRWARQAPDILNSKVEWL
jgi:GntR family transcriptional regulator, transcriptional repressor for pyruvate dehydrogenase complex